MNFQNLTVIEKPIFYLDLAFGRAKKRAELVRDKIKGSSKSRINKSKDIELAKIDIIRNVLVDRLDQILTSYPSFDQLPEFYKGLVKCTLDYAQVKKSLGAINWCSKKVNDFYIMYKKKIAKCEDLNKINQYRREYYGRISSAIDQIGKELRELENARKTMKGFPAVKTEKNTIVIIGFPNVGKTTLLYKLTGSKPEINDYPFTTRNINVGNFKDSQLLDTPGTLNRFNKMNNIERQAHLAMKHVAHKIIYIFDLTESYPIKDQIELYNNLKEFGKPVIIFLSKVDLLQKEQVAEFKKKFKAIDDVKKLKELI
jgi:nucleolar GTP-binding protein